MEIKIQVDLGSDKARRTLMGLGLVFGALVPLAIYAATTKPFTFTDGATISASQVNQNFDTVYSAVDALVPPGSIIFFDGTTCPTGYGEVTAARGRVIVGLVSGGTLARTVDTALSNGQSTGHSHSYSEVPAHSHGLSDPGHRHNIITRNDDFNCSGDGSGYFGVARCPDNGWYRWNADNAAQAEGTTTGISVQTAGVSSPSTSSAGAVPYIQYLVCRKS